MACRYALSIAASLMLLTLAFQAMGSDATVSASGTVNPSIPNNNRRMLLGKAPRTVKARRRTVIKSTFTSSGDFFGISADQRSGITSAYLSLSGYNSVSVSSGMPNPDTSKFVYFSFFTCVEVEPVPGEVTLSCSDTWASLTPGDFKFSINPKTLSATASATFIADKITPGVDTPANATVSFSLTLPCKPANLTRTNSGSACNSFFQATNQPTTANRYKYNSAGAECQIVPGSIAGSILVDGVDMLSTFVKSPDTLTASAYTSQNKDASVSVTKTFLF